MTAAQPAVWPPSSVPSPHILLSARREPGPKRVLTQCVCMCVFCTDCAENRPEGEARNPKPQFPQNPPRPAPGLPEPRPFVHAPAAGSGSVATRLTKCPLCFKTKGQANLEPSCPQCALAHPAQCPYSGPNPTLPGAPAVLAAWTRSSLTPSPGKNKQKTASFPRRGHPSHLHPSPQPPFPVGTEVPALRQALGEGSPGGRRPLLPAEKLWPDLLSASVQVPGPAQGAPGLDAAKTRRGPARESHARHPRAASGPTTIRRPEVRPAQSRTAPAFQEHQGLGARAPQGAGSRAHGGQS